MLPFSSSKIWSTGHAKARMSFEASAHNQVTAIVNWSNHCWWSRVHLQTSSSGLMRWETSGALWTNCRLSISGIITTHRLRAEVPADLILKTGCPSELQVLLVKLLESGEGQDQQLLLCLVEGMERPVTLASGVRSQLSMMQTKTEIHLLPLACLEWELLEKMMRWEVT